MNDLFSFLAEEEVCNLSNTNPLSEAIIKTDRYLRIPRIGCEEDPLKYYNKCKESDPELYDLVLEFYSVCGSSVPVERLFSRTGYLVSDRRNRLTPENVQKLSFLNANYELVIRNTNKCNIESETETISTTN